MISIVISSANKELLQAVEKNIGETIGVPYELLPFDNSDGRRGICAVYNEGIDKARFALLCFMHEDVAFHTKEWGKTIVSIFDKHKHLGVLGIAGSSYKPLTPTGWHGDTSLDSEYSNLLQSFKHKPSETYHHIKKKGTENLMKVASVDGVWLCVPKAVAGAVRFDEETFQGFHCYDLDFCLAVGQKYDVAVTHEVLLQHFSEGNYNREWMIDTLKLHKKWCRRLPLYTEPFSPKQIYQIERQSFKALVQKLIVYRFPAKAAFEFLYYQNRYAALSKKLFWKLHYYILLYFYLKKKKKGVKERTTM